MGFRVTASPLCLVLCLAVVAQFGPASSADLSPVPLLVWHDIREAKTRGALCNDFSPAGYFLRTNNPSPDGGENLEPESVDKEKPEPESTSGNGLEPESSIGSGSPSKDDSPIFPDGPDANTEENGGTSGFPRGSNKWVIYLEGGGGCTTPRSCNVRFIDQRIREQFTSLVDGRLRVDVPSAWKMFQHQPLVVTSKLMTSLARFSGGEGYAGIHNERNGTRTMWGVEGKTILSVSLEENPDFYQHNHVLIPYCSSDLWLKQTNNYKKALSPDFTFLFNPRIEDDHQFTFRGASIFRSVISDLLLFHGLSGADEVILAGSSAGGVGAMNHAKWLQEELRGRGREGKLYVVLDSAWFIDFRGEITNQVCGQINRKYF